MMMDIFKVFYAPSAAAAAQRERPRWLVPLAIVVGVTAAAMVLVIVFRVGLEEQLARLQELIDSGRLPPQAVERIEAYQQNPTLPLTSLIGGPLVAVVSTLVQVMVMTALLYFMTPVLGGATTFPLTLSLVSTAALIRVPGVIIRTLLMFLRDSARVWTGLVLFFPFLPEGGFLHALLARLDFFVAWELVALAIGLTVANRITRMKAFLLVFGIWVLYVVVTAALGGFRPGMA